MGSSLVYLFMILLIIMAGEKAVPPFDIDDNDAVPTVILAPASLFDIQMYSNLKRYLFDIRFL